MAVSVAVAFLHTRISVLNLLYNIPESDFQLCHSRNLRTRDKIASQKAPKLATIFLNCLFLLEIKYETQYQIITANNAKLLDNVYTNNSSTNNNKISEKATSQEKYFICKTEKISESYMRVSFSCINYGIRNCAF